MHEPPELLKPILDVGSLPWLVDRFTQLASSDRCIVTAHNPNIVFLAIQGLEELVEIVTSGLQYGEEHEYLDPFHRHWSDLFPYLEFLADSLKRYPHGNEDHFFSLDVEGAPFIAHIAVFPSLVDDLHFGYRFPENGRRWVSRVQQLQLKLLNSAASFLCLYKKLEREIVFEDHRSQREKDVHILVYPELKPGLTLDICYTYVGVLFQRAESEDAFHLFEVDDSRGQYRSRAAAVHAAQQQYKRKSLGISFASEDAAYYSAERTVIPLFVQRYLPKRVGL